MVTITDIAKALGITPSTVSRALSGSTRVREETRRTVQEKAHEMGYEPNVVASNFRKGQSKIVGIIVPRINSEFFSNIIGGAETVLGEAGYNCLICQTQEDPEAEEKALRTLKNYRVAAIFVFHELNSTDQRPFEMGQAAARAFLDGGNHQTVIINTYER